MLIGAKTSLLDHSLNTTRTGCESVPLIVQNTSVSCLDSHSPLMTSLETGPKSGV